MLMVDGDSRDEAEEVGGIEMKTGDIETALVMGLITPEEAEEEVVVDRPRMGPRRTISRQVVPLQLVSVHLPVAPHPSPWAGIRHFLLPSSPVLVNRLSYRCYC